jgi:ABC-2 type transport system ATP-binding protein
MAGRPEMSSVVTSSAITVEHLTKRYGDVTAVHDVSFEVRPGEIFGIIGPNGSGKTTTVECLQGLRRADGGTIDVLGMDPRREPDALRRRIGAQLQESALPDRIKVWEALDLFAALTPQDSDWETLIGRWGLADKRDSMFGTLSGGQQQRLFIALALVNNPEIVFLDEMTTGLDPASRRVAWSLIEQLRGLGTTVVLVTHFMDEAERLCDRIVVIDGGRVIAAGSPRQLIIDHAGTIRVSFTTDHDDLDFLDGVRGVESVTRDGMVVEVDGTGPLLALVAAALVEHGIEPPDLRAEGGSLEDVFLRLTGHRDGEEPEASGATT